MNRLEGGNPFHPNKIGLYLDRLEQLRRGKLVAPVTAEVDLTDSGCNQGCSHCTFGSGFMSGGIVQISRGALQGALTDLRRMGTKGVEFVGGGEPTVHREAASIMQDTVDMGMDAGLITNGVLLNRVLSVVNKLRYLRVSLDSANPDTYEQLHGVPSTSRHHERVVSNLRAAKEQMTTEQHADTALGIGYLVVPPFNHSEREIRDAVDLAMDIGVDYVVFRPAQLTRPVDPAHWEEAQQTITAVRREHRGEHTKLLGVADIRWKVLGEGNHPTGPCNSRPLVAVIKANGDIPHCILYRNEEELVLGNINRQSFSDIWFSDENQQRLQDFDVSGCPTPCKHYRYNEIVASNQVFSEADLQGIGHPNHV